MAAKKKAKKSVKKRSAKKKSVKRVRCPKCKAIIPVSRLEKVQDTKSYRSFRAL